MKYELVDEKLTFYLEGELNSATSEETEEAIDAVIEKNEFNVLVIDLDKLTYMSSAGLRIMMKLRQKHNEMFLINVPDDVYDVFSMVGLTSFFNVKRK